MTTPPPPVATSSADLTKKQKEEIQQAFTACDLDGSGYISPSDLKIALRAMGFEPRKNDVKKLFERFDVECKGKLCFTSFMAAITYKLGERDSKEEILKAFRLFDKDNTGVISFDNLRTVCNELGEGLNDEEIREMIEEADVVDFDGAVSEDEFTKIMKKTSLY